MVKKSIATVFVILLFLTSYGQSNITWTIKDQIQKGAVKTMTVFNSNISGFVNKEDIISFCKKIKSNPEVASCNIIKNYGSSCDIKLVMKHTHDKKYYAGFATKMGISLISINGTKKTPVQWIEKKSK